MQPQKPVRSHNQYEKMDVESPIDDEMNQLKLKMQDSDFKTAVELLSRIFGNIRENLIDEKYRTLKKSNPRVNALLQFPQVLKILRMGGF